jgi:predicted acyltransferase
MSNNDASVSINRREAALDMARGYAMVILLVYMTLPQALKGFGENPLAQFLKVQLGHATWHGLTYVDLGLPAFIQIVGISIVYSLSNRVGQPDNRSTHGKILVRTAVLFLLGLLYNGGFSQPWPHVRFAGVLQRIAICYGFCALLFLHSRIKGQVTLLLLILCGYWAMLNYVPVPSYGAGNYSFEGNLAKYVDSRWLPGRGFFGSWDSEGILTTLPAIATCIGGILIGEFFRNSSLRAVDKVLVSFLIGGASAIVGLVWMEWVPLNKYLWTPPFIVICQFHGLVMYGLFYFVCEVLKKADWGFPLIVVGANPLLAYLAIGLLPFHDIATRVVGADLQSAAGSAGPLLVVVVEIILCWLLLYWFYRNRATVKI